VRGRSEIGTSVEFRVVRLIGRVHVRTRVRVRVPAGPLARLEGVGNHHALRPRERASELARLTIYFEH